MLHPFDDRYRSTDCIAKIIPTGPEVKAYVWDSKCKDKNILKKSEKKFGSLKKVT